MIVEHKIWHCNWHFDYSTGDPNMKFWFARMQHVWFEKDTEGYKYDIIMPKPRTLSVSKQCDECGQSSPVACRQCKCLNI